VGRRKRRLGTAKGLGQCEPKSGDQRQSTLVFPYKGACRVYTTKLELILQQISVLSTKAFSDKITQALIALSNQSVQGVSTLVATSYQHAE